MPFELDRPLYLTEDRSEVVEEGDERARYVLGGKGSTIPDAEAARLGLGGQKVAAGPSENKMAQPAEANKTTGVDATDAARELAEAEGIDLARLKGTGADGRILKSDVDEAISARDAE